MEVKYVKGQNVLDQKNQYMSNVLSCPVLKPLLRKSNQTFVRQGIETIGQLKNESDYDLRPRPPYTWLMCCTVGKKQQTVVLYILKTIYASLE